MLQKYDQLKNESPVAAIEALTELLRNAGIEQVNVKTGSLRKSIEEAKIRLLQKANEDLQKRVKELEEQLEIEGKKHKAILFFRKRASDFFNETASLSIQKKYNSLKSFAEQVDFIFELLTRIVINNKDVLRFMFGSKKGSHSSKNKNKKNNNSSNNSNKPQGEQPSASDTAEDKIKDGEKELSKLERVFRNARKGTAGASPDNKLARAMGGSSSDTTYSDQLKPDTARPSPGKQGDTRSNLPQHHADDPAISSAAPHTRQAVKQKQKKEKSETIWICPNCSGPTPEALRRFKKLLDSLAASGLLSVENGAYVLKSAVDEHTCPNCGFSFEEPSDNPPAVKGSSIALRSAVVMALFTAYGMPLNASRNLLFPNAGLGSSTMDETVLHMTMTSLMPMAEVLNNTIDHSPLTHADETYITQVLGSEIRKRWLLVKGTGTNSPTPCVYYSGPADRTKESIENFLRNNRSPFLVTDAYQTYHGLSDRKGQIQQNCLAHLQTKCRRVTDNMNPKFVAGIESDEFQHEFFARAAAGTADLSLHANAVLLLQLICSKLSCVFDNEEVARLRADGDYSGLLEARAEIRSCSSRGLMDDIDTCFKALAEHYCRKLPGGKYEKSKTCSQVADAVTYYMNSRAGFRAFLDHPEIDVDNNSLEHCNRTAAKYRNNSQVMRSEEKSRDVPVIMTLVRSALLNGISNIACWLYDVASWYQYHGTINIDLRRFNEFRKLQAEHPDGIDPKTGQPLQRRRVTYHDPEFYADYLKVPCPKWLLPWNWVRLFGPEGSRQVEHIPDELMEDYEPLSSREETSMA